MSPLVLEQKPTALPKPGNGLEKVPQPNLIHPTWMESRLHQGIPYAVETATKHTTKIYGLRHGMYEPYSTTPMQTDLPEEQRW